MHQNSNIFNKSKEITERYNERETKELKKENKEVQKKPPTLYKAATAKEKLASIQYLVE